MGEGGVRNCQLVALETVCLNLAISSMRFMLASLFTARVFRMRWERSVQVSLSTDCVGVSWLESCLRRLEGRMKECCLRVRYLLGVVLMDLERVSRGGCGSGLGRMRGVSGPPTRFSFWEMRERPSRSTLKDWGFELGSVSRIAEYPLESCF